MATIVVLGAAAADDDDDDDDDAKEDFLDNRPRRAKRTRAGRRSDFLKQECGAPLDADADTDDDDDDDTVVVVLRVVANLCIISLSLSLSFFYYCGDIFSFFFSLFALTFDQDEPKYEIPFCFPTKKDQRNKTKTHIITSVSPPYDVFFYHRDDIDDGKIDCSTVVVAQPSIV